MDLIEQVLQYGVLVLEVTDERVDTVLGTLRPLASVMKNENAIGTSRRRGRPEIDVGQQFSYLLEQGFRTKDTSTMFGCSSRTIQRRMKKYELSHLNFMSVSDAHLDSLVKEITYLFPKCGEKTVNGRLRSCNIRVPHQRIRFVEES